MAVLIYFEVEAGNYTPYSILLILKYTFVVPCKSVTPHSCGAWRTKQLTKIYSQHQIKIILFRKIITVLGLWSSGLRRNVGSRCFSKFARILYPKNYRGRRDQKNDLKPSRNSRILNTKALYSSETSADVSLVKLMPRKTWILDKQLWDAQSRISRENDENHIKKKHKCISWYNRLQYLPTLKMTVTSAFHKTKQLSRLTGEIFASQKETYCKDFFHVKNQC
jgi:hypothetical protein